MALPDHGLVLVALGPGVGQPCLVPSDISASYYRKGYPAFTGDGGITEALGGMGGGGDAGVGDGPAKAMLPLQDWTPGSLSSVSGPVTHRMVAEECDTLVREKHQASPPKWPKKKRSSGQCQPSMEG